MADPTVEEIVKATEYASVSQSVSKTSLLISATERILRDQKISISDSFKADFCYHFPIEYMTAYALARKAYDTLLKGREEQSEISEKVVNIDAMVSELNLDMVITKYIGSIIVEQFVNTTPKPRKIILPVSQTQYSSILRTTEYHGLTSIINLTTPEPYNSKKVELELYDDQQRKKQFGFNNPVGEVRVEFGVRE